VIISPDSKVFIYFWSGTGNSYRISHWLGKVIKTKGINVEIKSIDNYQPPETTDRDSKDLIGVVFPTHGFTAPWHMLKFAFRLPPGKSRQAFCVAARAGLKFGRFYPPGISGSATFIIALILMLKGYKVRGAMSVDMPSNWFSLHPIQSKKNHDALIKRGEKKVIRFMEKIVQGRKVWLSPNNLYEFIWGILLSWISVAYLFAGRFFLAKLFFANSNCEGCGICADHCSVKAIKMWGRKKPTPFWRYNCESCMRCAAFCPHKAIEAGHSWGVILYFISAIPVSIYIFTWLDGFVPGIRELKGSLIGEMVDLLYYYPAIFISYYIFFALIQIPWINWLFTHTTITHFWGRYREPNVKLKNISIKRESY